MVQWMTIISIISLLDSQAEWVTRNSSAKILYKCNPRQEFYSMDNWTHFFGYPCKPRLPNSKSATVPLSVLFTANIIYCNLNFSYMFMHEYESSIRACTGHRSGWFFVPALRKRKRISSHLVRIHNDATSKLQVNWMKSGWLTKTGKKLCSD